MWGCRHTLLLMTCGWETNLDGRRCIVLPPSSRARRTLLALVPSRPLPRFLSASVFWPPPKPFPRAVWKSPSMSMRVACLHSTLVWMISGGISHGIPRSLDGTLFENSSSNKITTPCAIFRLVSYLVRFLPGYHCDVHHYNSFHFYEQE